MNLKLEHALQLGLLFIFLAASAAGLSNGVVPLQAHLDAEKSEWVLGVPIEFTVSVLNISNAPVQTRTSNLHPKWGEISLFISEDGSNFRAFWGPEWDSYDGALSKITLNPGAKVQASFSLLWNGPTDATRVAPTDDFAFPHATTYSVEVEVASDFGRLMSNVVRVVVKQPHGDDAAIWGHLEADKGLARYYGYQDGAPGQGEKLEQLLNKYPNSSHVASMKKALAVHALQETEIEEMKKARSTPQPQR
jgi:hypothetical protein